MKYRELLARLISYDTVSSKSNMALIHFAAGYLETSGYEIVLTYSDDHSKANLYASAGPRDRAGLVLSGHTDVVPVRSSDWSSDPFKLRETDDRYYGRGTCDMKGFLAVAMAVAAETNPRKLKSPLHLAMSYDEEVGCLGVGRLIHRLNPNFIKPRGVIVGEPSSMQPVTSHKSVAVYQSLFRGHPAHSSNPEAGVSAISAAARMITSLETLSLKWRNSKNPLIRQRTLNTGLIKGGLAPNIVPDHCETLWDMRLGDTDAPEAVWREINHALKELVDPGSVTHQCLVKVAGLSASDNWELENALLRCTGAEKSIAVSYLTEAGLFQRAGIPAVVCGPGSIREAHQNDEFVCKDQLALCRKSLQTLVADLCH